jgi:hypothetical protein
MLSFAVLVHTILSSHHEVLHEYFSLWMIIEEAAMDRTILAAVMFV